MGCRCHISPPCSYCVDGEDVGGECPVCRGSTRESNAGEWCTECDWMVDGDDFKNRKRGEAVKKETYPDLSMRDKLLTYVRVKQDLEEIGRRLRELGEEISKHSCMSKDGILLGHVDGTRFDICRTNLSLDEAEDLYNWLKDFFEEPRKREERE